MKILYYSPHPNLSLHSSTGYGTHIREMINAFELLGHTVIPVVMGSTSSTFHHIQKNSSIKKIIKYLLPKVLWETLKDYQTIQFDKKALQKLAIITNKEKPDLIYERAAYLMQSGYQTAQKYNIKYYIEINAPVIEEKIAFAGKSLFISTAESLVKNSLQYADKVIVVSSALKNYFQEKYILEKDKIIITPNAINPENVKINDLAISELRKKYSFDINNLVIGFVGSIFPYHGVDSLIKVFSEIHNTYNHIRLLIVGSGMSLPELKKLIQKLNITDKIIFTGNVPNKDIYNYISLMDVTVMAKSNWYGSPVKIFEYGALGKAIIAPNNKPVNDVLKNNTNGLLIENNPESLKNAMIKLIEDSDLRASLGLNAKNKILQDHTWQIMAKKIIR